MAREYIVKFTDQTVSGAITVLFVNPPAGRVLELVEVSLNQRGTTTGEMIGVSLGLKASVFPTLTSATPEKTKSGDPTSYVTGGTAGAAGTAGTLASAEGAGTFTEKVADSFYNLQGYLWQPTARSRIIAAGADSLGIAVKLRAAPTGTGNWSGRLIFAELDGG
jgi:hypothetical protein